MGINSVNGSNIGGLNLDINVNKNEKTSFNGREVSGGVHLVDRSSMGKDSSVDIHDAGKASQVSGIGGVENSKQVPGILSGLKFGAGKPSGAVKGAIGGDHGVDDKSITDRV
jgi:hypothetical protein